MPKRPTNSLDRQRDSASTDASALAKRGRLYFSRQALWVATSRFLGYDVFGYQAVAGPVLGPVLAFELRCDGSDAVIDDSGLIDSGADNSAFPLWMMDRFGIRKEDCEEKKFDTAGGEGTQWVWRKGAAERLSARILGRELEVRAVFTDTPIALLGRNDFFHRFKIKINQRAMAFGVKPYRDFRRKQR